MILALAKGDRTRNRDRIHATLTAHGIASGLLDNTAINAAASRPGDLARALEPVDAFTGAARAAGRRSSSSTTAGCSPRATAALTRPAGPTRRSS